MEFFGGQLTHSSVSILCLWEQGGRSVLIILLENLYRFLLLVELSFSWYMFNQIDLICLNRLGNLQNISRFRLQPQQIVRLWYNLLDNMGTSRYSLGRNLMRVKVAYRFPLKRIYWCLHSLICTDCRYLLPNKMIGYSNVCLSLIHFL